jgi:hypothetical protein
MVMNWYDQKPHLCFHATFLERLGNGKIPALNLHLGLESKPNYAELFLLHVC